VVLRLVHTGGHTEYAPVGHAANLAARMQSAAPAGGIIISADTRHLVEGYFELRESGPTEVKGVAEPIDVYEVIGAGPLHGHFGLAVRRGLTKFVGREGELKQMAHALELARGGHGQMIAVVAEAGTGKSRLFYEFKATLPADCKVLEAYSVSHGKASAWLPVLALLHDYFGIQEADDPATRRDKLRAALAALDRALADTQPYLFALLTIAESPDPLAQMDPQVKRRRTVEALKRIVLREGLKQPMVIIFEDLHWIDGETQALLDLLADGIANARVLMAVNYRPEYRHEWGNKGYYSQLRLDPLGRQSAAEMLSTLLGDGVELNPLKRLITERTEGNPFFIEEMVQALFDQGALVRNGAVKVARSLSQLRLPPTVQGLLASRIDRLPREHKELVQTLAVMGRESPLALIRQVTTQPEGELEQMLATLQAGEFIYEAPAAAWVEYTFKHALTQEVAYNSLLAERRRALHDRAASGIEDLYAHQLEDHYNELAYHYLRGNDAAKAIQYAQLAAEQAVRRAAYAQAMSLINDALKLLGKPESVERSRTELGLRTIESTVAFVLYGSSSKQREQAVRRMCELGESIGEGDQFLRALSTLSSLYFTQGESARGLELARRCLALGGASQDDGLLVDLRYNAAMLTWRCGSFQEAASHFEEALRQAHRTNCSVSPQFGVLYASVLPAQLSLALLPIGRVSEAAKVAEEGLRQARESRHLFSLGYALAIGGAQLSLERRQPDIARAHCEEAIALSEEHGFAEWLPWGRFIHGWALFELGQVSEGLAEMEVGIASFQRLGGVPRLQYLNTVRAEAIARTGRIDKALTILNETLANIGRSGDNAEHSEMLRLKGEVLLMGDRSVTAEAEKCFREALAIARAQEAKWWELRTTVSLARLLRDTDRRDEGRTLLTEIYNWFTEGFDTADLKEAKALLDELAT
jgi:tetratricopeptide (TPR) repeat protein